MSSKLLAGLKKKMGANMLTADKAEAAVTHFIDTGSDLLNANISNKPNGGWPCRRIVELFGQESIGKTTLIYQGMKNCQDAGGIVLYCDVEQAISPEMMDNIGVNRSEVLLYRETALERIFEWLEARLIDIIELQPKKLEDQVPVLILLDSLAQMTIDQELELGYESNMNTSLMKAKLIGQSYRKITKLISEANACFVVINQLRDAPGQLGANAQTTPGGKATRFAASVRIMLKGQKVIEQFDPVDEKLFLEAKAKHKAKGGGALGAPKKPTSTIQIGCNVTAKVVKNKIGPPNRECNFDIIFMEGLNNATGLFDWGFGNHIIDKINNQNYGFAFDGPDYARFGKFKRSTFARVLEDADAHELFMKEASPKLYRVPVLHDIDKAEETEELKALEAKEAKEKEKEPKAKKEKLPLDIEEYEGDEDDDDGDLDDLLGED